MAIPPGALQIQTNNAMTTQQPAQQPQPTNNGQSLIGTMPVPQDPQLSGQSTTNSQQSASSPPYYGDQQNAQVTQPINPAPDGPCKFENLRDDLNRMNG